MTKDLPDTNAIADRIADGLKRVAAVLRSDEWAAAQAMGVTPTQLQILNILEGRMDGLRVTDIASHLGVSQPSATDSVNALQRKGYVEKAAGADRRASPVTLTPDGHKALRQSGKAENATRDALEHLPAAAQEELLLSLVRVINTLQQAGAVPVQRMCITCKYFEPHRYAGKQGPHHCHFVNAPLRRRDFRVDCREHEIADPDTRAATWASLQAG
jgi:DNA-binding MarR family transcriptional regulator